MGTFRVSRLSLLLAVASLVAPFVAPKSAEAFPPKIEVQTASPTGSLPKGVTMSPDGRRLYVTNYGTTDHGNVSVYDASTLQLIEKIDVPGVVVESAIAPDGRTLYVSNFKRNAVQFVDLESKKVTREIKAGMHPKILVVSKDGHRLFAANWGNERVSVIDTKSGEVLRTLMTEKNPRGMAVTKGGRLYVANFNSKSIDIFEGAELETHRRLKDVCVFPRHLALSPDESKLYVSCLLANQVAVLDTKEEKFFRRVQVGRFPKALDVTPDGRYVVTADYRGSSVSIIDTTDWSARTLDIPSMDAASGIVVAHAPRPPKEPKVAHAKDAKETKDASAKDDKHAKRDARDTHDAKAKPETHAVKPSDASARAIQSIKLGARPGATPTVVTAPATTPPAHAAAHTALKFFVTGWYDNHLYAVGVAGTGPRYSVDSQTAQLTLRHRRFHLKHPVE